jgi:exopolysaccharide production protein ExoY
MSDFPLVSARARASTAPPIALAEHAPAHPDPARTPEPLVPPVPALPAPSPRCRRSQRALDVAVAAVAVVVSAPLLLALVLVVKTTSRGPAFYRPVRVGRHGRTFRCLKLRTMVRDADVRLRELLEAEPDLADEFRRDQKLRRDPRVTRVGRILRRSSLDEIPQLLNVLRGDMSIVGWRPLALGEPHRYGLDFDLVCQQRPGITGAWQTSGRSDLDYGRRVELDVRYACRRSVAGDVLIMAKTIGQLLPGRHQGAY